MGSGGGFEQLSAAAQNLLRTAALCGDEFDLAVLHQVIGLESGPGARVLEAVSEAEMAGFIEPVARSVTGFRFCGDGIAGELAGSWAALDRARLHGAIGDALSRIGAPLAAVADHLLLSAPFSGAGRAVASARIAAEDARNRGDWAEVARYRRLGVQAAGFVTDLTAGDRAGLLIERGEAEVACGDLDAASVSLEAAAAFASGLDAPGRADLWFRAATAMARWPTVPQRDTADVALRSFLERALAGLGGAATTPRAILLARLAQSYRWSIDRRKGLALAALAREVAERLGDQRAEVAVLLAERLLATGPGQFALRPAITRRLLQQIGDEDHPDLPLALFLRFGDQLESGDLTGASATSVRQLDLAERLRQPGAWWLALRNQASLALLAGHLGRAEDLAGRALGFGRRAQHPRATLSHEIQLLVVRAARGTAAASRPFWREVAALSPWHLATHAWVEALCHEPDVARSAAADVLALDLTGLEPAATRLATLVTLAATLSAIGWREPAGDLRAMLEPSAGQVVTVFNGVICLGGTDLALGRLALLDGDLGRAEAHLRRSIVQHDRMGAVLLAGQGRAVLGRLLQRRSADPGAGGPGAQLLAQARAAFRSRDATGLERLAAADEPAIRARAEAPAVGGLSAREVEVLELLADGLTNKQIAARLHLSAATVQRHTINLYRKIGVGGRSEAAAFAVHHGLHRTG